MASRRQIAANRRNARKSTGPRTSAGKLRSRQNATRHGLTAETVVTVFENPTDYQTFERLIVSDYTPRSVIEHQLVVRLASLLWRLRRATAVETGLFSIQARILQDRKAGELGSASAVHLKAHLYDVFGIGRNDRPLTANDHVTSLDRDMISDDRSQKRMRNMLRTKNATATLYAQCFLRVARLDDQILERLSRYETGLWRQAMKIAIHLGMGLHNGASPAP
jgi:hypothetical protein